MRKKVNMKKYVNFFKEICIYIIVIIIVLLIRQYLVALVKVNGNSMFDTLHNKDIMILNKIIYRLNDIERFDIVVIKEDDEYLIKRVIGLPGETLEIKDNVLYINGKKVEQKFYHKKTDDFYIKDLNSNKIPKNTYFVLGDNRTDSLDSRILGFIPRSKILGRARYTILPFSRFGIKK